MLGLRGLREVCCACPSSDPALKIAVLGAQVSSSAHATLHKPGVDSERGILRAGLPALYVIALVMALVSDARHIRLVWRQDCCLE